MSTGRFVKMKEKHYLIVYDIRDGKRLSQVEKCITSYAVRVQNSVYEATLSEGILEDLKKRLHAIIDRSKDFVLFFIVCERDWQKREFFGLDKKNNNYVDDDSFVIL